MGTLRAASAEMDAALKEEGFDEHGPLGVFSRYQRLAIEELGKIVVSAEEKIGGTIDPLCKRIEASAEEFRDGQLAELQALFKAGHQVLELAHEATKIASRAEEQTRFEYDQSIQRVAGTMATALLSETSGWLILQADELQSGHGDALRGDRRRRDAFHRMVGVPGARVGGRADDGCGGSLRGDVVFRACWR